MNEKPLSGLTSWWDNSFESDQLIQWLFVLFMFCCAFLAVFSIHRVLKAFVHKRRSTNLAFEFSDSLLQTNHWPFFFVSSIYVAALVSPLSHELKSIFSRVFVGAMALQVGLWLSTTSNYLFKEVLSKGADATTMTVLRAMRLTVRFVLWIAVFLVILDNFGVNISALVAGLGIGGIAVALGVQKIVGDIFASLSIVLDRPFVIGDFIHVGEFRGTVEDIGIKTTRIRSISGERIVFSNSDLLESRLKNFTHMKRRRVELNLGITYETPPDKVIAAKKICEDAVRAQGMATFEYCRFTKFLDSALGIDCVYWIEDPTLEVYVEVHEAICLAILDSFNKNQIEFAYPTQRQVYDSQTLKHLSARKSESNEFAKSQL